MAWETWGHSQANNGCLPFQPDPNTWAVLEFTCVVWRVSPCFPISLVCMLQYIIPPEIQVRNRSGLNMRLYPGKILAAPRWKASNMGQVFRFKTSNTVTLDAKFKSKLSLIINLSMSLWIMNLCLNIQIYVFSGVLQKPFIYSWHCPWCLVCSMNQGLSPTTENLLLLKMRAYQWKDLTLCLNYWRVNFLEMQEFSTALMIANNKHYVEFILNQ